MKKAVAAFRQADSSTVVLQAALNYFNARENMLTRMFTLEYNYWFYYMLPGLDAAGLPIPLGGTSNHFRTSALRELGGWDPHNVTEDADLGIRASALGYRVGVISSTTMEEANTSVPNFIRQRSRWIKGYMQTVLVHARRPAALMKEVGPVAFFSFLLLIGGTPPLSSWCCRSWP
ncbi:glycosyltransferase [Nesterenkonia pannonica]|uniref:glycosyltransferase family 2 protein n=1 Tax=Nesterenkonia pannonica TaxID=1548602 RepID=UPI0021644D74|nr:glycosyltransferase family 2 protein [Nesterenkonia pannonica]